MSIFKNLVASDINNVFLNLDELGEEHVIDGEKVTCVICEDGMLDRQGGAVAAVGQSIMTIYANMDDVPDRKGYGAELMVDGIPYMIDTWEENMGMATIKLFITQNS